MSIYGNYTGSRIAEPELALDTTDPSKQYNKFSNSPNDVKIRENAQETHPN